MTEGRLDGSRVATFGARSEQLLDATRLAAAWHATQTRKGKTTPYLSHLLIVEGLVIEHGGDPDQAIAALLHDALEDAPTPASRKERTRTIETQFGRDVLDMILDLTDTTASEAIDQKQPWRTRKERYIAQLSNAAARSLLVAACDKRHNLGDLVSDLQVEGIDTFVRFNAGPPEQLWYFDALLHVFRERIPAKLDCELGGLLAELRVFVAQAEAAPGAR